MKLSTSSNIHQFYGKESHYFSLEQSIEACHRAGFSDIDLTWHSFCGRELPLGKDDWKEFVRHTGETLKKNHITANQSHTIFYAHQDSEENLAFNRMMVERCIEANEMLSIPVTVMHILRVKDIGTDDKAVGMQKNVEYFRPYGDIARKHQVKIAIENGLTGFYHSADELLELLRLLDDDAFGLCWDTGHANITGQDQVRAIELMGDKLLAVHINDNNALKDQHVLPYFGTVDWPSVMHALHKIAYPGVLTFESPGSTKYLPPDLRDDVLRLAVKIGNKLGSL